MTLAEVRSRYLEFFKARGHTIIPSAPIVPENDPTTLFTSSGMQPLVPYLLGQPHPEGARLVDSQTSFRAGDIEEVGDNRHTTFFEMLGNWSLGDYFKQDQLPWLFEFLTKEVGLDPNKLYVTVFDGAEDIGVPRDEESIALWKKLFSDTGITAEFVSIGSEARGYEVGMSNGRIFGYTEKNWWSRAGAPANMPEGEPGGPDSEVFYDFGTAHDAKWGEHCHPNCDCGRFMEIGNSVFMEYIKKGGKFEKLAKQNVDFGGGLERIVAATLNSPDVFKIDVFQKLISILELESGKKYDDPLYTRNFRIIADHIRAVTFLLAAGVRPSGQERGSVVRKLMRGAINNALKLGIKNLFEAGIKTTIESYKDIYPHLAFFDDLSLIEQEEEKVEKAELAGEARVFEFKREHSGTDTLPPQLIVNIRTTIGTPISSIATFAAKAELNMPTQLAIEEEMQKHRDVSKAGAAQKFAGGLADHAEQTVRYHTAHHILLKALQMVLGPEVHQRGSNITSERLRIDFSYGAKMTDEQKREVEKIVNEKIAEAIPVVRTDIPREEAERLGAEQEFGAKYPDMVSVYSVGPLESAFSLEFCGGPHVSNTSELGEGGRKFKIVKEEASSAGVRRIKAVLE